MRYDDLQTARESQNKAKWAVSRAKDLQISDDAKKILVENAQRQLEVTTTYVKALERAYAFWDEVTREPGKAVDDQASRIHVLINHLRHPTDEYFKATFEKLTQNDLRWIESSLLEHVTRALSQEGRGIDYYYYLHKLTEFAVDYLASKGLPTLKQILEEPSVKAALAEIEAMKEAEKTAERLA